MSDDMPEVARLLGRQLGLGLIQNEPKPAGVTLRYATVDAVHSDGGVYTADLTVAGGELHAVPMTTDCVNLQPGDRCIVETANHLSIITGVLARPGTTTPRLRPPLLTWTSTWEGAPANEPSTGYVEKQQTINLPATTTLLCEAGAAISGTGEYSIAFDFQHNGARKAYVCATSPQKNGGTLRWTMSKTIGLPAGQYDITVTTYHWGDVTIIGGDSSGNSKRWLDPDIGENPMPRYAKITML